MSRRPATRRAGRADHRTRRGEQVRMLPAPLSIGAFSIPGRGPSRPRVPRPGFAVAVAVGWGRGRWPGISAAPHSASKLAAPPVTPPAGGPRCGNASTPECSRKHLKRTLPRRAGAQVVEVPWTRPPISRRRRRLGPADLLFSSSAARRCRRNAVRVNVDQRGHPAVGRGPLAWQPPLAVGSFSGRGCDQPGQQPTSSPSSPRVLPPSATRGARSR